MYQQAVDSSDQAAYSPPVDMSGYWGAAGDTAHEQQQQLQQPGPAGTTIKSAAAPSSTPGPPPLLNFRSDKAFMTADEVEKRQRAQLELQKELDQQIQDKKRRKVKLANLLPVLESPPYAALLKQYIVTEEAYQLGDCVKFLCINLCMGCRN